MTERNVFGSAGMPDLLEENDLVSATEMTGAIPAIRPDLAGSPRDCERGKAIPGRAPSLTRKVSNGKVN